MPTLAVAPDPLDFPGCELLKLYAVTVYVEASDAVDAVDVAGDVFAEMDSAHALAACGAMKVRLARPGEAPF